MCGFSWSNQKVRELPWGRGLGVFPHVREGAGTGLPLWMWPDCFIHAAAEDQPIPEALAAPRASPAKAALETVQHLSFGCIDWGKRNGEQQT